jgi:hypothetical protein
MEPVLVPVLETIWDASVVMEEQIQALATSWSLRPKAEVAWRPTAGDRGDRHLPCARRVWVRGPS